MLLRHEGFRRLCRARDLLREDREPSPSIVELARELHISPFHCDVRGVRGHVRQPHPVVPAVV